MATWTARRTTTRLTLTVTSSVTPVIVWSDRSRSRVWRLPSGVEFTQSAEVSEYTFSQLIFGEELFSSREICGSKLTKFRTEKRLKIGQMQYILLHFIMYLTTLYFIVLGVNNCNQLKATDYSTLVFYQSHLMLIKCVKHDDKIASEGSMNFTCLITLYCNETGISTFQRLNALN